jgi:pilus assembly protein CpaE
LAIIWQFSLENSQSVLFLNAHTLYNEYDLCQKISIHYPHIYIILIVPDNGENIKKAMHMGASDILRSSFKEEELAEAIADVFCEAQKE